MTALEQIRRRSGLSIPELAARLKIQSETLLRVECGGYDIPEIRDELTRRIHEAGLEL